MSWNSHAAQMATAKPATATRLSTATPANATHLSRGRFKDYRPPAALRLSSCRSTRLRLRRQRGGGPLRRAPASARREPGRFGEVVVDGIAHGAHQPPALPRIAQEGLVLGIGHKAHLQQ